MLRIIVNGGEKWDEKNERFIYPKGQELQLEHSLVSISKWEEKWGRAFLSRQDKTTEETLDYIKCMTITQNINDEVYQNLSPENMIEIQKYIETPMTATSFSDSGDGRRGSEVITAEIIDYWMIALEIPTEFRKWHLNKLLTLIRVCNIKNQKPKKMGQRELMSRNAALNAARKQRLNTKG